MNYLIIEELLPAHIRNEILLAVNNSISHENTEVSNDIIMRCFSKLPTEHRKLGSPAIKFPGYPSLTSIEIYRAYLLLILKSQLKKKFTIALPVLLKYCDDEEKLSIMKSLSLWDCEGLFVDSIIELCRTNSVDLFTSIGVFNPYPARFFPEHNFNQMVLKLLFCGIDINNVIALESRKNNDLARMALDYKNERIYADRSVPLGIELLL